MTLTTDTHQNRPQLYPTLLLFNHDCPDEPVAIKPSKYSQGKYQGNDYHKEYGDFRHNSHDSHCESAEGLYPTEEDGQLRTPGHMRESMSSFTGRPGIKGRNETIRMTMLCAVYCMSGYKPGLYTMRMNARADLCLFTSWHHIHLGC